MEKINLEKAKLELIGAITNCKDIKIFENENGMGLALHINKENSKESVRVIINANVIIEEKK